MKAVAIPYIIALVLGVVVIGLLGYWLVLQSGKTISGGITTECDALCVAWRNSGFNLKPIGINKCPEYAEEDGIIVCKDKLGCEFISLDTTCSAGYIDYGSTSYGFGLKVCCKG